MRNNTSGSKISIIIPAHNEENNLEPLVQGLYQALTNYSLELIIVDDGSTDNTLWVIKSIAERFPIRYLSFQRNFGHQQALKAGYMFCTGDCAVTMDADFQHPISYVEVMIRRWEEGSMVVQMIRQDADEETLFKKITSGWYYRMLSALSDIPLTKGSSDFRLIDKKIILLVRGSTEVFPFYRALLPWLGYKSDEILYKAAPRKHGTTKYSLAKMFKLATVGITSFSVKPLRLATLAGLFFTLLSLIYIVYVLYIFIFTDTAISGWASLIISVTFIGSLQLIFLGILGEYIGNIFMQLKNRPDFVIKDTNLDHA
jgi:dolichol-phosphate mannosyltransferase